MCGIFFKTNYHCKCDHKKFEDALELLNHRGPDETGILYTNDYSFGHKRLSIRDIENGHQPMSVINNHLIYNGELYNVLELKNLLKKRNVSLESNGDTLLLLKLLNEYKMDALNYLNGIFAFVYTDSENVYAVRDMFGVKPLYYTIYKDDLIVASEIKSILKYIGEAVVDKDGLCELLGMGPSHSQGKTVYKNIYEVKPGHMLIYNKNGLKITQYYKLKAKKHNLNYEQTVFKVRALLDKAIRRQMVSDVGIATFLSGGLDSSIISTVMAKYNQGIKTYSIDYEDNMSDFKPNDFEITSDRDYVKLVSDAIKSEHTNVVIDNATLIKNLTKAVDLKDSPGMTDIDSSMIYIASKIRDKNKVASSGEVADEIFGGYPWYYKDVHELKTFPWIRNIDFKEELLKSDIKNKLKLSEYVQNEYIKAIKEAPILASDSKLDIKHRQLCYLNIKYFMTNLLDRKDRMTMGESLEVRVPFCDKDLVEFLYNVPFKYKYRNKVEKKLLRDAYKDVVIKEVIDRKKSPYPKSNSKKYDQEIRNIVLNILDNDDSILNLLFDKEKLISFINNDDLDVPWYGQLMRKTAWLAYLYQLDYWYKKYNVRIEI